jgi:hypothetical protein
LMVAIVKRNRRSSVSGRYSVPEQPASVKRRHVYFRRFKRLTKYKDREVFQLIGIAAGYKHGICGRTISPILSPLCKWVGEAIKRLSSKGCRNGISALLSVTNQEEKSA